jgi:hypothetical protein
MLQLGAAKLSVGRAGMRLDKTARFLGRCFEFVFRRQGGITEAHVSLSKEPSWNDLSDCEKQARLHERW